MKRIGTENGLFTDFNRETGNSGTVITAEWLNTIQEELANVVEGLGATLDADSNTQLLDAIGDIVGATPAALDAITNALATKVAGDGVSNITVSDVEPSSPAVGDIWVDTTDTIFAIPSQLSDLASDPQNRLVTDLQKQTWDSVNATLSTHTKYSAAIGDGITDDSTIINSEINALSGAGGGRLVLPQGKVCKIASTILLRSNVLLDLNRSTLRSATNASLISNDITGARVINSGVVDGFLDGQSSAIILDLHSFQHSQFRHLRISTSIATATAISLKADCAVYTGANTWERNLVMNIFEDIMQDQGQVKYGLVLQGTNTGGFSAVTNNTFVGPMVFYARNVGYRFMENCDSNIFTGWHTVTLTTNDSNGACLVLNDTTTPSQDADVWGITFENFTCQTWYYAQSNIGKKGVVLNKCGGITIVNLGEDRPTCSDSSGVAFWGAASSNIVVDNYSDSHYIMAAHGNPTNGLKLYSKNVTGLGGSSSGDVVGPAGGTSDNAITRFDGTTGKLVQSSSASIDDNGYVTAPKLTANGNLTGAGIINTGGTSDTYALNLNSNLKNLTNFARFLNIGGSIKPQAAASGYTAYGICLNPNISDDSGVSSSIQNINGIYNRFDLASTYTGTITTLNGIQVGNPNKNGATGTISTLVGLTIDDITSGTNNWSMKIGSAPSFHRGAMRIGDGSTPAEKLEVAGNIKLASAGNGVIFPDGTKLTTASPGAYYASSSAELTALIAVVTAAGGGKIVLGPGTYVCPQQAIGWDFSGTTNVTIEGAGQGLTVLKWPDHFFTGAKANFWQITDYILRVGSYFTMRDLTIDGNKANQSYGTTDEGCCGVAIKGSNHILLENVEIRNTTYLGMNIMANGQAYTNTSGTGFITLRRCNIHDTYNAASPQFPGGFNLSNHIYGAGIIFNGSIGQHGATSYLSEITIEDTEIRNCGWDGINGWGFDRLRLINNRFINNGLNCDVAFGFGACGVYVNDVEEVLAIGNTAIGNTESGISISKYHDAGCKNVIISNNFIKNNNLGMEIIGLVNAKVSDNVLIDNWIGLSYYDNIDGALSINASVDTTIENNTLIDTRTGASRQHYAIFDGTTYPGYYTPNSNLTVRNNIIKNFRQTFYNVDYSVGNQVDGVYTSQAASGVDGGTF